MIRIESLYFGTCIYDITCIIVFISLCIFKILLYKFEYRNEYTQYQQFEYRNEYTQYQQIFSITLHSIYTYIHCTMYLLEVIMVQNINWLYSQSYIYSFFDAGFLNLWQISGHKHHYKISTHVLKIMLLQTWV